MPVIDLLVTNGSTAIASIRAVVHIPADDGLSTLTELQIAFGHTHNHIHTHTHI